MIELVGLNREDCLAINEMMLSENSGLPEVPTQPPWISESSVQVAL